MEIAGINGAKIKRLIKDRKKRRVRKIIVPIADLNDSGVGQVLSVIRTPYSAKAPKLFYIRHCSCEENSREQKNIRSIGPWEKSMKNVLKHLLWFDSTKKDAKKIEVSQGQACPI
ncbi:hypothetical protein OAC89_01975 [Deltaproteobacteria bacterium]|nr:hypothetical protein [Deltaproteobacteria bacterium]